MIDIRKRILVHSTLVASLLLLVVSCSDSPPPAPETNSSKDWKAIAAKVDNSTITLNQVDSRIQFQLFELEESIYHLRKDALDELLEEVERSTGTEGSNTEIYLFPPTRPRIDLANDGRSLRGSAGAAVTIRVFCSYQSSHCVRLQPTLISLLKEYHGLLNIAYYDFPQRFHSQGLLLAQAVRCAEDQQSMWAFQDHILAKVEDIHYERLVEIAEQLKLNTEQLEQCLQTKRYQPAVEKDVELAQALGLKNVPVSFINGLYYPGPQTKEVFEEIINRELLTAKVIPTPHSNQGLPISNLPLRLLGSSVSNNPEQSKALIELLDEPAALFSPGETLLPQVSLHSVDYHSIIISNNGQLEIVKLEGDTTDETTEELGQTSLYDSTQLILADETLSDDEGFETNQDTEDEHPNIPEPKAILPLSRNWVDEQLSRQIELETQINKAEHVVEGNNLLKLSRENLDEFYTHLGMEPGDVLMMVNDQWAHSNQNPLWEALRSENSVTAVVIRRGFPVVYQYDIQSTEEK